MKKILFVFACFALFFISCNSDSKPVVVTDTPAAGNAISAMAQKNLDAMHVVNKAFETGDVSGIDSILAPNFVDHTDKGDMNGDSLKAYIKTAHAADKTMKLQIVKELADDEYAFAVMHFTGTGDGVSMPAGPYDMHTTEIVKFSNGKATEHWGYLEMGEVAKMMAKNMPAMDKMKMPEKGKKK
jgi:predicted SnoaL-like aldol condensation-catalyzing enzyme